MSRPKQRLPSPRTLLGRWWVAAAMVALLALVGGLLVACGTSGLSGPPATAPAPPPSPIGDPRTADPCSLLNVDSAQRFGQATMVRDLGYPQECVIDIRTGGEGYVWLWATFEAASDQVSAGVVERSGELTISREVADAGSCERTVVLGDRSRVLVTAFAYQGTATDLCAVADAGTQTAVSALSSGSLPRRGTSDLPNALTGLDTCSLLDQSALGQVPGLDATRRRPGFAGWLCVWGEGDNPAFFEPWVRVAVERKQPLSGQPVQIGGRSAQVTPGGSDNTPGTCVVELVQRSYTEASGDPRVNPLRVEVLQFSISLGTQQSTDAACRSATALAEAAAPKLPPA